MKKYEELWNGKKLNEPGILWVPYVLKHKIKDFYINNWKWIWGIIVSILLL